MPQCSREDRAALFVGSYRSSSWSIIHRNAAAESVWDNTAHTMAAEPNADELKMDPASLYREEIFTDRRVGTLRVLTPVKADGLIDASRRVLYLGEAQILTPAGVLPLTFEIEASSLGEAAERFAAGAKVAVERAVKELHELRREAASSIIVPDRMPGGFGTPGRTRGGGLIQSP
jgi:hypothetical protein